jgi:hypothetical protein
MNLRMIFFVKFLSRWRFMKFIFSVFVMLVINVFGVVIDVPRVFDNGFADGEESQDAAFQSDLPTRARTFKVEMSFNATLSNNIQIAFGADQVVSGDISIKTPDGCDGKLAAEETDLILGWDCGKYFLRPKGLRSRYDFPITNFVAGQRTLKASIEIASDGEAKTITFNDNEKQFSFTNFKLSDNIDWLKPDDWSLLRVTTRGADVANEDVKVKFGVDKMLIIIN